MIVNNFKKNILKSFAYSLCFAAFVNIHLVKADELELQRSLLNLQNQLNTMQDKLAEAQGRIDELNHQNIMLKEENTALKAKLSSAAATTTPDNAQNKEQGKENKSQQQTASNASLAQGNNQGLKSAPKEAVKLYQTSFDLLNKGTFDEAAKGFRSYTEKYQDTTLTPNAWYWLGQIQYKQKKYEEARLSFLNTAKFKTSEKRADALYKLGVTSLAMGDKDKARKFFDVLIRTYPESSSSALAKKELSAL